MRRAGGVDWGLEYLLLWRFLGIFSGFLSLNTMCNLGLRFSVLVWLVGLAWVEFSALELMTDEGNFEDMWDEELGDSAAYHASVMPPGRRYVSSAACTKPGIILWQKQ